MLVLLMITMELHTLEVLTHKSTSGTEETSAAPSRLIKVVSSALLDLLMEISTLVVKMETAASSTPDHSLSPRPFHSEA